MRIFGSRIFESDLENDFWGAGMVSPSLFNLLGNKEENRKVSLIYLKDTSRPMWHLSSEYLTHRLTIPV